MSGRRGILDSATGVGAKTDVRPLAPNPKLRRSSDQPLLAFPISTAHDQGRVNCKLTRLSDLDSAMRSGFGLGVFSPATVASLLIFSIVLIGLASDFERGVVGGSIDEGSVCII